MCDPLAMYDFCRVCGEKLSDIDARWARKKFQQGTCSTACYQAEIIKRFACCEKATFLKRGCVCMYAFECPQHGETHIGSHE